jgi:hypothetical protein
MPWNAVPDKFASGTLKSSSGQPVRKKSQMLAIMLSEKRQAEQGKAEYKALPRRKK